MWGLAGVEGTLIREIYVLLSCLGGGWHMTKLPRKRGGFETFCWCL